MQEWYKFCTFARKTNRIIRQMHVIMRKIYICTALLLSAFNVCAQVQITTHDSNIRTLRVVYLSAIGEEGQLSVARPILVLKDGMNDGSEADNTLHVSFDEMSHDVHFYTYTIVHMNAEWSTESAILSNEYLNGYTTQDITDYEHSMNTSREYTHYEFVFPNADMTLTKSGNYQLRIYEDGDPNKRVAEVNFCVVDPLVAIDARVRNNTDVELSGRYQQLDFDVTTSALQIKDPNEVKVLVRQNNRTDNQVWLSRPTFMEHNRLRYINKRELIFEGVNEYHHFDAFSTYYAGTGIDRVYHERGDYHALLFPQQVSQTAYIHEFDVNGQYIVNAERTFDPDTEGEYMWVYWQLEADKPWLDGVVYVGGDLFGNTMDLRNRMQYDDTNKCYWLTSLVKQGGYDYQYWFVGKGNQLSKLLNKGASTERTEGSFWQTKNEYGVYVYWRPFGSRYDQLVGTTVKVSTK